jgi:hypothetical protein
MGSKRQLSNSLLHVSSEDKKDKKLKGLIGTNPNSEKGVVKVGLILFFPICCMLNGHSDCASSVY